jgi:hypothetical protein
MFKNSILTAVFILMAVVSYGQTPGLIFKTAGTGASVLDPNGDGYTSFTTGGFTTNDQTQSEIPFKPIIVPAVEPTADPGPGPDRAFNDIVDSGSEDPVLTYYDGTNLLFRFRLGGAAPNSKGYSILIDSDQKFGFSGSNADANAVLGNPGFEMEIVLRTNFDVSFYSVDGTTTPVLKASYSYTNYAQKSMALTMNCGDADYFYDFFIPFSAITTYFPSITTSTPLRMVAVTSMNPAAAIGNNAVSDVGGIDDAAYGNNYDNIFGAIIDNFYPTPVTGINGGFPADRTPCPSISGSITTSSTSISGTSTQANGTTITVYKNGSFLNTTTVSSGAWTLSSVSGLLSGDIITASATATGKTESIRDCTSVTVGASCSANPTGITGTINKNFEGNGVVGATIKVYKNGVLLSANPVASGTVASDGTFCWKNNGQTSCNAGSAGQVPEAGVYKITQTESGKCESTGVYICLGGSTLSTAPSITTTPILTSTTSIAGTSVASAFIILYANGVEISTATANGSGAWTVTVSGLTFGQSITAKALDGANCLSNASTAVMVKSISSTPVIIGNYCTATTISSISGTTTEASGTVIELFSGVTSLGTTTSNSSGAWTKTGLNISPGSVITATALATNKITSAASNSVTIGTLSSNAGLVVTSPIVEGVTSLAGTLSGTGTVKVYIDQALLGTATVSGTTWMLSGLTSLDVYAGALITATITSGVNCESNFSAGVTVQCISPLASLTISPTTNAVCSGSKTTLIVQSSESGIIYQLYNGASTSGSAVLGTGGDITLTSAALIANTTLSVRALKIFPSGCYSILSSTQAVTIDPAIASNTLTAPATVTFCGNGDPGQITGSTPTGGTGAYSYQWQTSSDNTTFTDIGGATSIHYNPDVLASTTYIRRVVTSGACTLNSSAVTITISVSTLAGNTLTAPVTTAFCASGDPGNIAGSSPTGGGGVGTYTYQWQSSTDNVSFADIGSATGIDYNPPSISETTYFRRVVTSAGCTSISGVVAITITSGVMNNTLTPPATTTFCGNGDAATITGSTPTGGSGSYTYQWKSSSDNSTFNDISGETSIDLDPTSVTSTTYYSRVVTSGSCILASSSVTITITPSTLANNTLTAPATTTFCGSGDAASIIGSTPTGGSGSYTYQWQSSTDNTTFGDISGETGKDFNPPSVSATTYYRRLVTSGGCSPNESSSVTITITPSTLANNTLTAPATTTFCGSGDAASITGSTPTGGSGSYTYQWQSSTDNTSFGDISGETSKDFNPPSVSATTYYRRLVTSGACSPNESSSVTITITPSTLANNTLTAPATTTFCGSGDAASITGSTPTGGSGSYTYQWQSSTDNTSFGDISGETSKDFNPPSVSATTYYRRLVTTGSCSPNESSSVTITITPSTLANNTLTAPATTTFCGSGDAA